MNKEELKDQLKARPFKPFRIVTSDGYSHEVRHPELVMIGSDQSSRTIYLFEPANAEADEVKGPPRRINLTHVTTLEPVEQNA